MSHRNIFYGWIVVGASAIALMATGGSYYGFGVFFKPLQTEFGWSHSLTSLMQTVFYMAYGISLYFSGRFCDKCGPRPLFAAGSLMLALGFGFSSQIQSASQLIPLYIVAGLGTGTIWATAVTVVQRWFVKKRGLAVAIASIGVGLGTLIFSPLLGYLISIQGWRMTYIILGVSVAGILASSIWFMVGSPEQKGLRPYGVMAISPPKGPNSNALKGGTGLTTGQAIKSYNFVMLSLSYIFSVLPISLVTVHIVPYAIESGISATASAGALGLIGAMSIPGRLVGGMAADKLGWKKSTVLLCFFGTSTLVWLIFSKSLWMFYLFTIFFGFSHGTRVPLLPGLVSHLFGTRSLGELTGLITGLGVGLGGMGALLAGFIVDTTGDYIMAFVAASVSFALAAILTNMLRPG